MRTALFRLALAFLAVAITAEDSAPKKVAARFVPRHHHGDPCPNDQYRALDGSCNNEDDPDLGSAGQFYRRGPEGAEYGPGNTPVSFRPIERVVSNKVARDDPALVDPIPHSLFATQFGQFINHDIDNNAFDEPYNTNYPDGITIPEKDDSFCLIFADLYAFNFTLINACVPPLNEVPLFSTKFSTKVVDHHGVAQIPDMQTHWLDLSQIYDPDTTVSGFLRTHTGGKLLTKSYTGITTNPSQLFGFFQFGPGDTAPFDCIDCLPSFGQTGGNVRVGPLLDPTQNPYFPLDPDKVFVSGDARVGENVALGMFHLLFIRNHNRHAAALAADHPSWDDEKLFQEARRINIAEYQNIVMYQYFPTEFGEYFASKIGPYHHYDEDLDASVNVAFSTVAFRYGHSSFRNYQPISKCGVPTMFFQPAGNTVLLFGGQTGGPILPMDTVGECGSYENGIRGLINQRTGPNDVMFDAALRDIPFNFPVAGGTDLLVLDMHRARENGVPNYVALQKSYGRQKDRIYGRKGCPGSMERKPDDDPQACWDNLVPYNATLAANLRALYKKVKYLDPILGILAEVHIDGTSFGETVGTIIADTYGRLRDGDRYWFENRQAPHAFSHSEIDQIRDVGIDDLLRLNFHFESPMHVPANPFLVPPNYRNALSQTAGCP